MTQPLVILGTGGGVYDLLDLIEAGPAGSGRWELIGFLDDARQVGTRFLDWPVLGRLDEATHERFGACRFSNAIASDRLTGRLPEILGRTGLAPGRFATLIHPAASVSARAELGPGVTVHPGAVVAGATRIGACCLLGPHCVVGHETILEPCCVLAPGAVVSGRVRIGTAAYLGAGCAIRQSLTVGAGAVVGLGAVVVREVAPGTTVVGNPARPLER